MDILVLDYMTYLAAKIVNIISFFHLCGMDLSGIYFGWGY